MTRRDWLVTRIGRWQRVELDSGSKWTIWRALVHVYQQAAIEDRRRSATTPEKP